MSALTRATDLLPLLSFNQKLILLRLVSLDLTMNPENFIRSRQDFVQTLAQAEANAQSQMPAEAKPEAEAKKPEAKEPKAKEPKKAKAPSTGTMACMAFVKHCQEAQPTRFSVKDRGHVLSVAKEIRHEDEDAYKSFVENWKDDDTRSVASVGSVASEATAATAVTAVTSATGEKRAAHPGTLIFSAYAKHIMEKHPDLFTEAKTYGEKLKLASQMRKADETAYQEFAKEWKEMKNTSSLVSYIQASPPFQSQSQAEVQAEETH